MEKEKCYTFQVSGKATGIGYVYAKTKEEAIEKARNDGYEIVDQDIGWNFGNIKLLKVDEEDCDGEEC